MKPLLRKRISKEQNRSMMSSKYQMGFIISLELILIFTILVIGTLVGIVAIRDALFEQYVQQQSEKVIIVDDKGIAMGEAVDFDEHDAPRIFYKDRTIDPNKRVLISIRDDRFTSREPLYYQGQSCQGEPCIKTVSNETIDNKGVDGVNASGSVSYFNALQGYPNYAVGRGESGLPGRLYREVNVECSIPESEIGSRWISQKVVTGEPCEILDYEVSSATETEAAVTDCLASNAEDCTCAAGFEDQGDVLDQYADEIGDNVNTTITAVNLLVIPPGQRIDSAEVGTACCRSGTTLQENDDLVNAVTYVVVDDAAQDLYERREGEDIRNVIEPLQSPLLCESNSGSSFSLSATENVPDPNGAEDNAFDVFTAPFQVNLPMNASSETWISTPPPGEGNSQLIR